MCDISTTVCVLRGSEQLTLGRRRTAGRVGFLLALRLDQVELTAGVWDWSILSQGHRD
jgi:hypothetical protein